MSANSLTLLILLTSLLHSFTDENSFVLSSLSASRLFIQDGKLSEMLETGNSYSTLSKIALISSSLRSKQLTGITGTLYFSLIDAQRESASADCGSTQFITTTNGLLISFNSLITLSSASSYSSRGIALIEPSVVTTSPIVECSLITFCVPISAAILNGISSGNHGVLTILG